MKRICNKLGSKNNKFIVVFCVLMTSVALCGNRIEAFSTEISITDIPVVETPEAELPATEVPVAPIGDTAPTTENVITDGVEAEASVAEVPAVEAPVIEVPETENMQTVDQNAVASNDSGNVSVEGGNINQEIRNLMDEAKETDYPVEWMTCIYDADDLFKIAEDPAGNYILMNDIDMSGYEWIPVDFSGYFDGNGHGIMNLAVSATNSDTRVTYDGNMKPYDAVFSGFFGILQNAIVKDLSLVGINVKIDSSRDCFVGTLAGYMDRTYIDNCKIEGEAWLTVNAKMFGVGGIVGYGGPGLISNTTCDVTLVCIDADKDNKDEQFLGGAISTGYTDVDNCKIYIKGYDSDHGYVHNGGLNGMYMLSPKGTVYDGYITNNYVEGFITFFEDNKDRRAYCRDIVGENLSRRWKNQGNTSDFLRDERYDYGTDLVPHNCENPVYENEISDGNCEEFGYVIAKCTSCNEFTYKLNYSKRVHSIDEWETVLEPTTEERGLKRGTCSQCGIFEYEYIPVLEIVEEPEIVDENIVEVTYENDVNDSLDDSKNSNTLLGIGLLIVGIVVVAGSVFAVAVGTKKNGPRGRG